LINIAVYNIKDLIEQVFVMNETEDWREYDEKISLCKNHQCRRDELRRSQEKGETLVRELLC